MDSEFSATDELYHELRFLRETQALAEAYDDPALGGTGKKEPILCTNQYGKGRVFFTALGHEVAAMSEPGFITTFVRGTEWAATGKVSLPVFPALSPTSVDAIRLLVVTGGHDHDPSFYGLFEDEEGWNTTVVDTSQTAFRADLNSRFDVLVLYDLTQEINEIEKKNLRNFLENRNGLVVLHHALADYSDWDWWTREVIGGEFLLKPEGKMAASTYRHDEELFIRPETRHVITAAIGPMHLWDETYKGMWISPEVKVLLRTNNPNSDGPVAWIGPYSNSRVVAIQLGHGPSVHRHPAYQALIKNAIFWVADKMSQ
jgi:hypothetical protein